MWVLVSKCDYQSSEHTRGCDSVLLSPSTQVFVMSPTSSEPYLEMTSTGSSMLKGSLLTGCKYDLTSMSRFFQNQNLIAATFNQTLTCDGLPPFFIKPTETTYWNTFIIAWNNRVNQVITDLCPDPALLASQFWYDKIDLINGTETYVGTDTVGNVCSATLNSTYLDQFGVYLVEHLGEMNLLLDFTCHNCLIQPDFVGSTLFTSAFWVTILTSVFSLVNMYQAATQIMLTFQYRSRHHQELPIKTGSY
ncbi:hypothetical protein BGZ58_009612 [Dissophora ornata]|nr:hypothetical protein BGZ58_009612 [Dissophora ornata]